MQRELQQKLKIKEFNSITVSYQWGILSRITGLKLYRVGELVEEKKG